MTLPTGGTINYTYSGGSGTNNSGVVCADGSTATLTRTTPDTPTGTQWIYAHSESGTAWTTTVTDPQSNVTVINFQGIYVTEQQSYQGSNAPGNLKRTQITCYNGNTTNCNTTAITLPITTTTVTLEWPGTSGEQSQVKTVYDGFGNVVETDEYDYASGNPGGLVRKTLTSYASLGNGIVDSPSTVTVEDGSGNIQAQTTYTYDGTAVTPTSGTPQLVPITGARGNATKISSLVTSSTQLSVSYSYFDTGNVQTMTDVNGAQTTITYGACGNSFATLLNEPLSLSRSITWNCIGGVATSVTDENNNKSSVSLTDNYFWRGSSMTDAASNTTNVNYKSANQTESSLVFPGGSSSVDALTTLDALGRNHISQVRQAPSSANYDTIESDFDSLGRPNRSTLPYTGTAGQTKSSPPETDTLYDALGRTTGITNSGNLSVSLSYPQNDVYQTVGPAPTGENAKIRQVEYDGLGRVTSVCEITSVTGSGTCKQTNAVTGYWTQYTYDVLGDLTGVTQNAQSTGNSQSRSYSYDALGRMTQEINPESGTTKYTYDSDTTCGITSNGDLVKKVDAYANVTCFAYDALHRPVSVIVQSGPYATSTPYKYFVYDLATVNSVAMVNVKGRMAEAYTSTSSCPPPCGSKLTDVGLSYTASDQVSDVYESTPHSSGYYHVTESYWPNGALNQLSNLVGLPTITYNVDGEGRIYSATASSGQNPLTGTTYNVASEPLQVTLGSGDSDVYTYDPNTNRMAKYSFNVNGQSETGTLTWNAIGTLSSLAIVDPFNSADNQTCTYTHDDLTRIHSATCGSVWSQTFTYDAFGNITKSGSSSFSPSYSYITNRMTQIGSSTPTYDANGNVTNDFLHTYTWNAAGRPVTIDGIALTYDALGRVVEENRSGAYTEFVYAPNGQQLGLMNGQTMVTAYVPLPAGDIAAFSSAGLQNYHHADWLGSSRLQSTTTRSYFSSFAYAPFGETYAVAGPGVPAFTGMTQNTDSNLYDFPAREYGIQGRWPSPDPSGIAAVAKSDPQTWNRYAYLRNSPLQGVDPLGLKPAWFCQGMECAAGSVTGALEASMTGGGPWGPGMLACGVDPFCLGNGGIGPFGSPVAHGFAWYNSTYLIGGNYLVKDPLPPGALVLNCTGESLGNMDCSWASYSIRYVINGNQHYYVGWAYTAALFSSAQQMASAELTRDATLMGLNALGGLVTTGITSVLASGTEAGLLGDTTIVFGDSLKSDAFHSVPGQFASEIIEDGYMTTGSGTYVQYNLVGYANGELGTYQMGGFWLSSNTFYVTHYFFQPLMIP